MKTIFPIDKEKHFASGTQSACVYDGSNDLKYQLIFPDISFFFDCLGFL